jgi:hypothetical protein
MSPESIVAGPIAFNSRKQLEPCLSDRVCRVNRATRQGEGMIFWNLSERRERTDANGQVIFWGPTFASSDRSLRGVLLI